MSVPEIPEGQGPEMDESSQLERPPSPPGSYLSMESDEELPVNADEDGSTPAKVNLERTGSPETKFSEIDQYSVKPKEGTFFPKHGVYPEGEGSLETKQSPMEPCSVQTRKETVLPKHGSGAVRQPVSSRAVNSDLLALKSMVLEQGKNLCPMGMPYVFKSIQTILEIMTDEELALFKKYLHRNYSQHFENQMEDSDVLDVVDKMVERCGKVGAIRTTLRTLKYMKKPDLADYLQSKCCKVLIQHDLRQHLKMKYESIFEGIPRHGRHCSLNQVHVDVHMTEGGSGEVNNEHELRQSEMGSGRQSGPEVALKPSDLFEPSFVRERGIRTVLTRGIAGIGLTVVVQKFIVDWIHEKANQDIHFVFPLPFCELNLTKMKEQTLIEYLTIFYPEIKSMDFIDSPDCKVLFICDGLDDYRHSLTFKTNGTWTNPRAPTSVDMLLTNFFRKNLLPDSLVWITTRTAASNMFDMGCVDLLTQVYGFTDSQKEQYLRKKISDQRQANKIVAHVRSLRSLHIMAHIPAFSWMLATVFSRQISVDDPDGDPMTTTEFFTHYMLLQANMMMTKYYGCISSMPDWSEDDRDFLMKLGKLGLKLLEKGAKEFHPGDLKDCGLEVKKAIMQSGLCTEVFPQHSESQQRVFCFVHLSVQEFLAAFYVYMSFRVNHRNVLDQTRVYQPSKLFKGPTLVELLISAVDKALKSQNGHLDMFLRFVLGLSVNSIQRLFRSFMTLPDNVAPSIEETVQYIKKKMSENVNPDRCRNLSHCLTELEG